MSFLLEPLEGISLFEPLWLLMLLLIPVALLMSRHSRAPAILFSAAPLLEEAAETYRRARRSLFVPLVLLVLGLALLVVALARPVSRSELPRRALGIDIVLVMDRSSSMKADDLAPGRRRIELVREAAIDFVKARPQDRIGLVTFARYPDLRCPPTLDHEALIGFLELIEPVHPDGEEDATGIGTATALAARVLERGRAEGRSGVVIMLTDGEENVASSRTPKEIAPLHAAQLCADLDLRVHVIAAGTGRIEPGGKRAPLDVSQIKRLAQRSGGRFFGARDAAGLQGVYAEIDRLESAELEEPRYRIEDRFLPFLVAAVFLLLASRFLGVLRMEVLP